MKLRQQIDFITGSIVSGGTNYQALLDTSKYSGTVTYKIEVQVTGVPGANINLTRVTGGTVDAFVPSGTAVGVYTSATFTPPTGATEYYFNITSGTINSAKIIVLIDTGSDDLTAMETQIELGNGETGKTNTTEEPMTFPKYYKHDSSKWDGTLTCYFESTFLSTNSMYTATVTLQVSDGTGDGFVGWSNVVGVTSTTQVSTRIRTTSFTPISGRNYRIVALTSNSMQTYDVYNAKIIIQQTGTTTKLQPQYLVANTQLEAGTALQNFLVQFNPAEWDGVDAEFIHAVPASNNNTSVISLYNVNEIAEIRRTLDLSALFTSFRIVNVSPDGSKMYVAGNSNDTIYQHTLTTPFNITTASIDSGKTFVTTPQDGFPICLFFSSDGLRLFILGYSNKRIYQYTLGTAWDISTVSYDSKSFLVPAETWNRPAFTMSPDGTKMYLIEYTENQIYQYALSTAWDISTASYSSITLNAPAVAGASIRLSDDGLTLYYGIANNQFYKQTLGTAWNISTAGSASSIGSYLSGYVDGGYIAPDGLNFYSAGTDNILRQLVPAITDPSIIETSIIPNSTVTSPNNTGFSSVMTMPTSNALINVKATTNSGSIFGSRILVNIVKSVAPTGAGFSWGYIIH